MRDHRRLIVTVIVVAGTIALTACGPSLQDLNEQLENGAGQAEEEEVQVPATPPPATLAPPSVAFFYFDDIHEWNVDDEAASCYLSQNDTHYTASMAGVGVRFLLELDFPGGPRAGTYDASLQGEVSSGGHFLARGPATIDGDLAGGTFELETSDGRPVLGSWAC